MKTANFEAILEAYERIKNRVHRTPVLENQSINQIVGNQVFFKCENFQKVGAFKFRGATNAIMQLSDDEKQTGVATHSSGNHAAALALAAQQNNISAHIVMPNNAPLVKQKAVEGYGAFITFCEPTLEAREATLKKVIEATGAIEIHPYDNNQIIAGQGTAALELLQEIKHPDFLLVPVGGGGLLAGSALAAKQLSPTTKVIACEPLGADDAYRSFCAKKLIPSRNPQTIADGLLTSVGKRNFELILNYVDGIVTVSEESIVQAMQLIWERMKIIVEPSSTVPLAALLEKKIDTKNKSIAIILSGGNVDLSNLPF